MPLNTGDVFAGYTIERLLGTGGMGEVYLTQHPRLPRHDALKILTRDSAVDGEFRARFIREAELAATLRHPNIVGVLDRGEFDGRLWISMDYVDGTDAGRLIRESYPNGMPEQDVAEIVTAVADALDFGHERRLLHRDVKPENILVTESDGRRRRVLLTDFGIARRFDDVSNLTDDGVAVGTVNYMAPEQLLNKPLDGRTDQYALAATTFHLLTGAPPFHDPNRAVVISHHLSTPPPRISDRRPDLAHLDAVLARALAKDVDQRYPTCLDFANALSEPGPRRVTATPNPATARLERLEVHGTAHGVTRKAVDAAGEHGTLSFQLVPYDRVENLPPTLQVEIETQLATVALADGDEVEVSGVWDGATLEADTIATFAAEAPAKRRSSPPRVDSSQDKSPKRGRGRIAAVAALARRRRGGSGRGGVVHRRLRRVDAARANRQAGECDCVLTGRSPRQPEQGRVGDRRGCGHVMADGHLPRCGPVPEFHRGRGADAASVRADRAERRHHRSVEYGNRGADPLVAHRNPERLGRDDGAGTKHTAATRPQPDRGR